MPDFNNQIKLKDIPEDNDGDFYKGFKEKLIDVEQFPTLYTFKFIVKADSDKVELVKAIFQHPSTKFSGKNSSGGKYQSITVESYVNTADEVIDFYKKVGEIPDVMML
ncbi:MAG: DUF493 domain-containing protein [Sphingobacterium sp.]